MTYSIWNAVARYCDQDRVRKKPLDKGVVIQQRIMEEVDIDAGQ